MTDGYALTRAETTWTLWRLDGTLPGLSAQLEDGAGRRIGFWMGADGYGYSGRTVQAFASGKNRQTSVSVSLTADEVRRLAASLLAMADELDARRPAIDAAERESLARMAAMTGPGAEWARGRLDAMSQ